MGKNFEVDRALKLIAKLSIDKSSQVFSKTIRAGAKIVLEDVYMTDISEASITVNQNQDEEVVGAFIDLIGEAPFKFLFFVKKDDSLALTDLMLQREIGTTKEFDVYAQSAVQEIGNILASAISNVFAADFQITMKPSPPVVVRDFAGTVFSEYLVSVGMERDEILIIESLFQVTTQDIQSRMFILPMPESEKILQYVSNSM